VSVGLARHVSNLSAANLLTTVAGLVSFPILTRLLSVEDYGVMNLVATLLAFAVAAGKLGVQHASLRFHGDARRERGEDGIRTWAATVVVGMTLTGAAVTVTWSIVVALAPEHVWNDARMRGLLLLTASLLLLRTIESALTSLLRAREETGAIALFAVARRWLLLAATLGALLLLSRTLWAFFGATLVVELIAVLGLFAWVRRRVPIAASAAHLPTYRAMLAYGLPMIGVELATVVLTMGDRYLIQRLLDAEQLGLYTAAYNLCDYVRIVALAGIVQALLPSVLRTWSDEGPEATATLLSKVSRSYALIAFPTVAGVAAVADVLLPLLASEKYANGARIVPWVMAGMAFETYVTIAAVGLLIRKRTLAMMAVLLASAVLNIALNLAWIPRWGISGSAAATLVSYVLVVVATRWIGRDVVRPPIPWGPIAVHAGAAAAMHVAVSDIDAGGRVATLVVRVLAGATLYAVIVAAADPRARRFGLQALGRLGHLGRAIR
jgi:O-antigen/teichoic acid export membrane protein